MDYKCCAARDGERHIWELISQTMVIQVWHGKTCIYEFQVCRSDEDGWTEYSTFGGGPIDSFDSKQAIFAEMLKRSREFDTILVGDL